MRLKQVKSSLHLALVAFLFILMSSCTEKKVEQVDLNPLKVTELQPIQRDWDTIKKSKSLRMITRYNSISYFLHNGVEKGFEYDFLKSFAKENDLTLEIIIAQENENLIDLLNSGVGDIIAANYAVNNERKQYHDYSEHYNLVNQVIIFNQDNIDSTGIANGSQDITIAVRNNSSYYSTLQNLKKQGLATNLTIVEVDSDTETLLNAVANNEFEATIADDNIFKAASAYVQGLGTGPAISKSDSVAWGIRKNAPQLKVKLNKFVKQHYRIDDEGVEKRSAFLNILIERYFENHRRIFAQKSAIFETKYTGVLSPFDKLIKPLADSAGIDWKMVVSIAAQESRFDPDAKSWAGAVGLLQINHRFSKYSEDELLDPEVNIKEAIRILTEHLNHYKYLDEENKWALVLATYNAGVGHVSDARRIVMDSYKDPNNWDFVEAALLKLMKREHFANARYGYCRGIETVNYVRDVMKRRDMYETILSIASAENKLKNKANNSLLAFAETTH